MVGKYAAIIGCAVVAVACFRPRLDSFLVVGVERPKDCELLHIFFIFALSVSSKPLLKLTDGQML